MARPIEAMWFTNRDGSTGIVRTFDIHDGYKYYIGHIRPTTESQDSQYIADWGSTFPTAAGDALFGIRS
jgi:hypothetical protein